MRAARSRRARARFPRSGEPASARAASSGAQSTVVERFLTPRYIADRRGSPRASSRFDGEAAMRVRAPAQPRIDRAEPVADMFWGDRFGRVTDAFGVAGGSPLTRRTCLPRRSAVARPRPSSRPDAAGPRAPLRPGRHGGTFPGRARDSTDHLPWNRGSRFSRKAATPSRWSSVRPQRRCVIASRLRSVRKSPVAAMFTFSFM